MPKSPFFSSVSYLPGAWRDFRLAFFFGGGEANDMLPPLLSFGGGHGRIAPPPGSAGVWEEKRSRSRYPAAEIPDRRPGPAACVKGWCACLAVLACSSGVWCGVGVTQIYFKIV